MQADISVEVSVQRMLHHPPDQINAPRQLPGLAVDLNLRLLVSNLLPSRGKVGYTAEYRFICLESCSMSSGLPLYCVEAREGKARGRAFRCLDLFWLIKPFLLGLLTLGLFSICCLFVGVGVWNLKASC